MRGSRSASKLSYMDAVRLEERYNRELEEMTEDIREGIKSGKFTMAEFQRAMSDKTREAATATNEFVQDNPWTSLGIAAVIGCVAGLLINRR